jgi:WD40 repeat protein
LSHDQSIINHVRFVASADDEGFIVIWDLVLKASICTFVCFVFDVSYFEFFENVCCSVSFKAHASRITALHWSTSRRSLVSVGHDCMVKSWQLHDILTNAD